MFHRATPTEGRIKIRFLKVWEMHINVDIYSFKVQHHKGPNGHFTQLRTFGLFGSSIFSFVVLSLFAFKGTSHCCCGFCDLLAGFGNKLQRIVASAPEQDENCLVGGKRAKQKMSTWTEVKVFVERSEFPFIPKWIHFVILWCPAIIATLHEITQASL